MIETIILCTIFGVFILFAYTLGLRNGQKLTGGEKMDLPKIKEPAKEIFNSSKIKNLELNKEEQISWENINNYDGTRESQKIIK